VPTAVFTKHQLLTPRNVDLVYPLDTLARADTANGRSAGSHEDSELRNVTGAGI
jgi:hypothetical protein